MEKRDDSMIGVFVYGVRTTGVFCRPGCAARRPLRRNVEFFDTCDDAMSSGYRACQRCQPENSRAAGPAASSVVAVCRRLEQSDGNLDISVLASEVGYSERHLRRLFTRVIGVSIGTYQRSLRADHARRSLRAGDSVTSAIADSGFGSTRAFYEHGAARLGMPPARYRSGGLGEEIAFTTLQTPIGVVVAAQTSRGVCSVQLGHDVDALEAKLFAEFPHASLTRDDQALRELALVLAGAIRGETNAATLPIDVAGTAFQVRVWEALRAIPSGRTVTYSQVADAIGAPRAVRAVGSACGANHVALVIPCHRVIRGDGSLGGYRWGIETKRSLLDAETASLTK